MVVAHKSTSEEIGILRKVFERYDTSRDGSISQEEFKVALECYGYTDDEVERMFTALVSWNVMDVAIPAFARVFLPIVEMLLLGR